MFLSWTLGPLGIGVGENLNGIEIIPVNILILIFPSQCLRFVRDTVGIAWFHRSHMLLKHRQLDQRGTLAQEKDTPQKDQEPGKTECSHDLIQGTKYPRTAGLCLSSVRHFIPAPEGAPIFQNSLS